MNADRARLQRAALWVGVPLAIVVLCWHALPLEPKAGLDYSWEAGLHMALHYGITFGNHLIFTYGPLGFVSAPTLWYGGTGTIAVLYALLLRFALALALFMGARRSYGTVVGAVVAVCVALASAVALETVPFLMLCVWMLERDGDVARRLALTAAVGALVGLELLNKESSGIEMAVMAVIVALCAQDRRRDQLIVTVAAMVLALLLGWEASGQSLGLLGAFIRNAAQIISGYSSAMSFEDPSLSWQYGAGLLAFAFGLFAAWQMPAGGSVRRRWGIVALWVAFCFFEYKEGFVRHDSPHAAMFFVALMGGFPALRWRWGGYGFGLGALGILLVFALVAQGHAFDSVLDPGKNAVSAVRQLVQVSSPSESASIMAKGRREIEREYPIDRTTLALLRGRTVHVEPFQTPVVWAYRLDWRPLPAFQSYVAYTSSLDRQNADALNFTQAPQRILRTRDPGIDGRVQAFDQPLSARAMLCRYRELRRTTHLQVLGLGADRCVGSPVSLGTVRASWYQKVAVPAPPNAHSFVFVRIGGVQVGGLERVRGLLYRPAMRMVLLDRESHRLIEGTAMDGLVLRAPTGIDFTPPFSLAPDPATIAVAEEGTPRSAARPITFAFYAQAVYA